MTNDPAHRALEAAILPHLDSAYTLARYLLRQEDDARDAVQEACLRAVRYFRADHLDDPRAWLLAIVRNTCHTMRSGRAARADVTEYEDDLHTPPPEAEESPDWPWIVTPEQVRNAIDALPVEFREVIILREVQDCSYEEIASVVGVPVGTVMSRLSRARQRLRRALTAQGPEGI